jgi:hypothetical protein
VSADSFLDRRSIARLRQQLIRGAFGNLLIGNPLIEDASAADEHDEPETVDVFSRYVRRTRATSGGCETHRAGATAGVLNTGRALIAINSRAAENGCVRLHDDRVETHSSLQPRATQEHQQPMQE